MQNDEMIISPQKICVYLITNATQLVFVLPFTSCFLNKLNLFDRVNYLYLISLFIYLIRFSDN